MSIALRPLSTGEVLDRTFVLYRKHFFLFTGIAFVQVVFFILGIAVLVLFGEFTPSEVFGVRAVFFFFTGLFYGLVGLFFYGIGYALATGATTYAVSKLHLGAPATIRGSYREARPMMWRSLRIVTTVFVRGVGTLLLTELMIIFIAAYLVRFLITGIGSSAVAVWAIGLLNIGLFVGGLVLAIRIYCQYSLAVPAGLLEKLSARQALKRSKELSRRALRRIFIVFLLMSVLGLSLYYLLQLPVSLFFANGVLYAICELLPHSLLLPLHSRLGPSLCACCITICGCAKKHSICS